MSKQHGTIEERFFAKKDALLGVIIFAVMVLIYALTAAPTVYFGDSGELTAAAYNLGIAHPPGYPLYLLSAKAFTILFPFGEIAFRVNVFSGVFAALTCVEVYLISRLLGQNRFAAALTGFVSGLALSFWSQAVIAEIYTMAAMLFCTMILILLCWLKKPSNKLLFMLAITSGLALTHHIIIAAYFPVFFVVVARHRVQLLTDWKLIAKLVLLAVLPLCLYVYLPLRSAADPLNDWGNPERFSAVIDHIRAKQFGGLFLKYGAEGMGYQLGLFWDLFWDQWSFIPVIAAVAGIVPGLKAQKTPTLFLLALGGVNLIYATTYFISDIEPYFIPFFLIMALLMGYTFNYIYYKITSINHRGLLISVCGLLSVMAVLILLRNWRYNDRSHNRLAYSYGVDLLSPLQPNSSLFVEGDDELFILAYLKIVENFKPDVQIYDCKQNLFYFPAMKQTKHRSDLNLSDLFDFSLSLLKNNRPVYFTEKTFPQFQYQKHGFLYEVVPSNQPAAASSDFESQYDMQALNKYYPDLPSRETVAKYYYNRALTLDAEGHREAAVDFIEKTLAATAGLSPKFTKLAAIFFLDHQQLQRAETLALAAQKLNPLDSDNYNTQGMVFHYRGRLEAALACYNRALRLRDDLTVLVNRGIVFDQLGDGASAPNRKRTYYRQARDDFRTVLARDPNHGPVRESLKRVTQKLTLLR